MPFDGEMPVPRYTLVILGDDHGARDSLCQGDGNEGVVKGDVSHFHGGPAGGLELSLPCNLISAGDPFYLSTACLKPLLVDTSGSWFRGSWGDVLRAEGRGWGSDAVLVWVCMISSECARFIVR